MQIRPHQQQVVAVEFARTLVADIECGERRAISREARRKARRIGLRPGQPQQCVAVADAIVQRAAVIEPDMRKPRARPGRRHVFHEIRLGRLALLRPDDARAARDIAKLGADHFIALALLDIGDARQVGAGLGAFRRIVPHIGPVRRAPGAPSARGVPRRIDIARADLPALGLIGGPVRPSLAASRPISRTDRWHRRRRCSCRGRRSG